MIVDFRYSNLICKYFVEDTCVKNVCFLRGYRNITRDNKVYCSLIWKRKKQEGSNYCFMSDSDLLSYFIELSKLLGFKIISFAHSRSIYDLQFICPANDRLFLYITTCMRYVYESPFSFLTACAWKDRKYFKDMDILHIIHFYLGLFYSVNNHSAGSSGYYYPQRNCKCEFNYMKDHIFNTTSFARTFPDEYKVKQGQRWLKIINSKELKKLEKTVNQHARKVYDEINEDIYRRGR